ncbi:MAG: endonuclease V, partial [Firmicutes bacterium]|nr:endonuclease V [Candidatus Stercoripulliclostridium pullicola]
LAARFAFGGAEAQKAPLEKEGVEVDGYFVDLEKYGYGG